MGDGVPHAVDLHHGLHGDAGHEQFQGELVRPAFLIGVDGQALEFGCGRPSGEAETPT